MPNFKIFTECLNQDSNLECLVSNPSLINCYEREALNLELHPVFDSQQNSVCNFVISHILLFDMLWLELIPSQSHLSSLLFLFLLNISSMKLRVDIIITKAYVLPPSLLTCYHLPYLLQTFPSKKIVGKSKSPMHSSLIPQS